jgi:hypothetical protein
VHQSYHPTRELIINAQCVKNKIKVPALTNIVLIAWTTTVSNVWNCTNLFLLWRNTNYWTACNDTNSKVWKTSLQNYCWHVLPESWRGRVYKMYGNGSQVIHLFCKGVINLSELCLVPCPVFGWCPSELLATGSCCWVVWWLHSLNAAFPCWSCLSYFNYIEFC